MRRYAEGYSRPRLSGEFPRENRGARYDQGYFRSTSRSGSYAGGGADAYDRAFRPRWGRERGEERVRDWWMGGPERGREAGGYDAAYHRFHEEHHPRFSPVGGMYPEMGGSYLRSAPPRPLRYDSWFSDWTRWF